MVEIQCPHCEEAVVLDEGRYGLFNCPHCDEQFSWSASTKWTLTYFSDFCLKISAFIFVLGVLSSITLWATEGPRGCESAGFLDFDPFKCGNYLISFFIFAFFGICTLIVGGFAKLFQKLREKTGYDF